MLLSSGVTVTWAHHSLIENFIKSRIVGLLFTVLLGAYFSMLQYEEYKESSFRISDGVYGSSFFIATGFHGIHVFIGRAFLLVCLYRIIKGEFS